MLVYLEYSTYIDGSIHYYSVLTYSGASYSKYSQMYLWLLRALAQPLLGTLRVQSWHTYHDSA